MPDKQQIVLSEEQIAEIEVQLHAAGPGGELSVETMQLMTSFESNQREYVRALCQTVRALRKDRNRFIDQLAQVEQERDGLREAVKAALPSVKEVLSYTPSRQRQSHLEKVLKQIESSIKRGKTG